MKPFWKNIGLLFLTMLMIVIPHGLEVDGITNNWFIVKLPVYVAFGIIGFQYSIVATYQELERPGGKKNGRQK